MSTQSFEQTLVNDYNFHYFYNEINMSLQSVNVWLNLPIHPRHWC
jgi:hypothetical protein